MINEKRVKAYQTEWEELNREFARLELERNSRLIANPDTNEIWWPSPWVDALIQHPMLHVFAEKFQRLEPELLAPLTGRIKELCEFFGLPIYEGGAAPNPLPGTKSFKLQTEALSKARKRCSRCGGKLLPIEVLSWRRGRVPDQPMKKPPQGGSSVACEDCGVTTNDE